LTPGLRAGDLPAASSNSTPDGDGLAGRSLHRRDQDVQISRAVIGHASGTLAMTFFPWRLELVSGGDRSSPIDRLGANERQGGERVIMVGQSVIVDLWRPTRSVQLRHFSAASSTGLTL
jgi:hypothetical protein